MTAPQENYVLTELEKHYSPKMHGPAEIEIGISQSENTPPVDKLVVTINTDENDPDHVDWYSERTVRTFEHSLNTGSENIVITWDGTDEPVPDGTEKIDGVVYQRFWQRILLQGTYHIEASAWNGEQEEFRIKRDIIMSKPGMITFPLPYGTLKEVDIQHRERMVRHKDDFDWEAVTFLDKDEHEDFNWIYEPETVLNLAPDLPGYFDIATCSRIDPKTVLDNDIKPASMFRIYGHHGKCELARSNCEGGGTLPVGKDPIDVGAFIFNGMDLIAYGKFNGGESVCSRRFLNGYCKNNNFEFRKERYLDDQLVAFVLGCRTSNFDISTTSRFLQHGADIVVGSKDYFLVDLMNFWSYYQIEILSETDPETGDYYTLRKGMEESFDRSKRRLMAFLGLEKEDDLKKFYGNTDKYKFTYNDLIVVFDEPGGDASNYSVYPAHYGRRLMRIPLNK